VHGIPSDKVRLAKGDIISIDCGVLYKGYYGDHAWTFPVGEVDEGAKKLLKNDEDKKDKAKTKRRQQEKSSHLSSLLSHFSTFLA